MDFAKFSAMRPGGSVSVTVGVSVAIGYTVLLLLLCPGLVVLHELIVGERLQKKNSKRVANDGHYSNAAYYEADIQ